MGYQVVLRVAFLSISLAILIAILMAQRLIATPVILGLMIIYQMVDLVHYATKSDRNLSRFLQAIQYDDFSPSFPADGRSREYDNLAKTLNDLILAFQQGRSAQEGQQRFLEMVIQHIGVAVVTFDSAGTIGLHNRAATQLLGVSHLSTLDNLGEQAPMMTPRSSSLQMPIILP